MKTNGRQAIDKQTGDNLPVLGVSEISQALKGAIEEAFSAVRVRGEISGYKKAASGHIYFSLKDQDAVLDGVCWRGAAHRLSISPEDGIEVIVRGRLTTYPGRSKYQIVIDDMSFASEGALLKMLEERKIRLREEGLFDATRKRPLPYLPEVIGIVTSPTGAAIRDILHRLEERFPRRVLLWPVQVQGSAAAAELVRAIAGINGLEAHGDPPRPDLLIVARGGGSQEDLLAFSDEAVVRTVAASTIPIISAIGHETDTTLVDYAADHRAPTPSAAAERAVPVRADLLLEMADHGHRMGRRLGLLLKTQNTALGEVTRALPEARRILQEPVQRLDEQSLRLAEGRRPWLQNKRAQMAGLDLRPSQINGKITQQKGRLDGPIRSLSRLGKDLLTTSRVQLDGLGTLLEGYSYGSVLRRGFALVNDDMGHPVRSAKKLSPGQGLHLSFADGRVDALVTKGRPKHRRKTQSKGLDDDQGSLF